MAEPEPNPQRGTRFRLRAWLPSLLFVILSLPLGYYTRSKRFSFIHWVGSNLGSPSRFIALLLIATNWKGLPFGWSVHVISALVSHLFANTLHSHGPEKLFRHVVSQSHEPLLEVDYNLHKSNATFFSDLDVSRTHMLHLLSPAIHSLWNNRATRLVMDPSTPGQLARGGVKIVVGAVQTSYKRELKACGTYEMWTRVLSWDRKWLYLATYFVVKGADNLPGPGSDGSGLACGGAQVLPRNRDDIVLATFITKLVFKIGRLTIHPAVVLDASGLLPPRPGGWTSSGDDNETPLAKPVAQDSERRTDEETEASWDWRHTERERRRGLDHAQHLAALDDLSQTFSGEKEDVLGKFLVGKMCNYENTYSCRGATVWFMNSLWHKYFFLASYYCVDEQ